ncbi:transcriptional regulator, Crp/Fnr family [Campylobacter blaseri]|uniref:Crp/Fnr family transcriptional regulator n=1 Tax=Campylobacter blaseri TaxID=2042961 RepID=A0A2P8R143_9BACT|nr:Crp/Fnr family transcriptional regulator [Campylobacter blaseri]PSM52215.1 Crp/Fnr family transcriptional regulator [Campylobacter blaseri]PSM53981.1 Crp/Fnr family transcriptional regulator [Campylobacter blaseri]QKF85419.1 transcriptional regulator, Crp/Fnr family [Campylobacter blaseri]
MLSKEDIYFLQKNFLDKFNFEKEDTEEIIKNTKNKFMKKDEILYQNSSECNGYIIVKSGILRAYISSNKFKEITVFVLKENEQCMLCSNCCNMATFNEELNLQVAQDCKFLLIPTIIFEKLKAKYPQISEHTLNLMSKRFNSVVTTMEKALFSPLNDRILDFLNKNNKNSVIKITHQELANHLGSAREVISRVLKELEKEKIIEQKRGVITIL